MKVTNKIKDFFVKGDPRSSKAKKNIVQMIFIKGGIILIGLLLVPITINYVDSERYGLWLTLSTMVTWINFFDIGLSHGMKNKLAEAFVNKDYELGKKYVSTTYALLCIIFIPLMTLLLIIAQFVNWAKLLNISPKNSEGLLGSICVIIVYFCLDFILSTINKVIIAEQKPANESFRTFIQNIISLIVIYILTLTTKGSLLYLCIALCLSPLLVISIFNITLFNGRYNKIAPSINSIDFKLIPQLMQLGVKFFIIQIGCVLQYQLINFIILKYYGANDVTAYNIGYKYFSILAMGWNILIAPLWIAVTDAITKKDFNWIVNAKNKYLKAFILLSFVGCAMLTISEYIYKLWIGDKVVVPFTLSLCILLYILSVMISNIYVMILNGAAILNTQAISSIISSILFLFLCYIIVEKKMSFNYIILSSIICNFNGLILAPIQCHRLLNHHR